MQPLAAGFARIRATLPHTGLNMVRPVPAAKGFTKCKDMLKNIKYLTITHGKNHKFHQSFFFLRPALD
jgi:hypothetical protein